MREEDNVKIIRMQVQILSPLWKEKAFTPLVNAERELLAVGTLLLLCSCLLASFHPLLAQMCPFLHPSLSHTPTHARMHTPVALFKSPPKILFPPFLVTNGFMGPDQPQSTPYRELNRGLGSQAAAWSTSRGGNEMCHHGNKSDTCPHMTP